MNISLGIILFLLGAGQGLFLGLYLGERGRRRDVMWWASLDPAPEDMGSPAEIEPARDPEASARERAEIEAVKAGLEQEARAAGLSVSAKDIEEEALRLVTQANVEVMG